MVLDRVGYHFLTDYQNLLATAIQGLYNVRDGYTWVSELEKDVERRQKSRYSTSVRVLSSLLSLKEIGFNIDETIISNAQHYLIDHFLPEELDAPDFVYLLKVISRRVPQISQEISLSEYYDYLLADSQPKQLCQDIEKLLNIWFEWSAARLDMLEPGLKLNIEDYSHAFSEEKSRIHLLLTTLARLSNNEKIFELAELIYRAPDSEAIRVELLKIIEQSKDRKDESKFVHFFKSAVHSLWTQVLPKYLAELSKP